jgi:hypothetical protein
MNMLIGMLKGLLPTSGDYRIIWDRCVPPDENKMTVSIWQMEEDGNSARKVVGAVIDWPKK